jgi:hypothetical protein
MAHALIIYSMLKEIGSFRHKLDTALNPIAEVAHVNPDGSARSRISTSRASISSGVRSIIGGSSGGDTGLSRGWRYGGAALWNDTESNMRTRVLIGLSLLFFGGLAMHVENLTAGYVALGTHAIIYLLHTIEAKLNRLLDYHNIFISDAEIARD